MNTLKEIVNEDSSKMSIEEYSIDNKKLKQGEFKLKGYISEDLFERKYYVDDKEFETIVYDFDGNIESKEIKIGNKTFISDKKGVSVVDNTDFVSIWGSNSWTSPTILPYHTISYDPDISTINASNVTYTTSSDNSGNVFYYKI